MRIFRLPGVYRPQSDTKLLIGALRRVGTRGPRRLRALELCTGSGAVAVDLAMRGHDVVAVDVARRAALTARINAFLNGTRVDARAGDLLGAVEGETFDLIVANPPYVPAESDDPPTGAARAWDAGFDGRSVLDRICAEAPRHLRPGGSVVLVHSSLAGVDDTKQQLREAGLEVDVVGQKKEPLGPISRGRADYLRSRGHDTDQPEDLVVIRGRLPSAVESVSTPTLRPVGQAAGATSWPTGQPAGTH